MVLTGAVNAGTIAAHIRLDSTLDKDSANARKSLSTVAGALTGVVVAAGAAALALSATIGKEVIQIGSDVEDMQGKFDAVFKQTAEDVEEWADTFGDAVGRSRFELMGLASSLQDTFVPMKFTREEGAEFSKQLVELAVDLNSFNVEVKSDKAAVDDLQSAIVGNHETMRKYGVIITETTLNQKLLTMGINGGVRAATEQQKATARLNLIFEGTTDAQGDAARTAGSLANMQRRLKSTVSEMMGEAGRDELPEMVKVLEDFDAWGQAGGYENMQGFFSDVAAGATAAAKGASAFGKAMTTIYTEFTDSIEDDIDELKVAQAGWAQQMLDSDAVLDEETRALLESRVAYLETSTAVDELKDSKEEMAVASGKAADDIVEDAKAVQAAFDTEIPGFAGQSDYIKSLIQEKGIELTKAEVKSGVTELDKLLGAAPSAVSAVTPTTLTAGTPQATAAGGSVSMLATINNSIQDGNIILKDVVSAVKDIVPQGTTPTMPGVAPRGVGSNIALADNNGATVFVKGFR